MNAKPILKIRKFDYVLHSHFGPLYINDSFRDEGGTCYCGINGVDGTSYQDYACGFERKLTPAEIEEMAAKSAASKAPCN